MFWLFLIVLIVTRGQMGRALAEMIAGYGRGGSSPAELDAVEQRLEERLMELEDRLDFTERLLQQQRNQAGLPPIG